MYDAYSFLQPRSQSIKGFANRWQVFLAATAAITLYSIAKLTIGQAAGG